MGKKREGFYPYEVRLLLRRNLCQHLLDLFVAELDILHSEQKDYADVMDDELAAALAQEEENIQCFIKGLKRALFDVEDLIKLMQVGKTSDHDGQKP